MLLTGWVVDRPVGYQITKGNERQKPEMQSPLLNRKPISGMLHGEQLHQIFSQFQGRHRR
eukprot:3469895-Pleurochrysis_carterae.AAC.3